MTDKEKKAWAELFETMTYNMENFQQQARDTQNTVILLRKRIEKLEYQIFADKNNN